MKIGELARRAGVEVQTVRYYERGGLLEAPSRTASGYRTYGLLEVNQLRSLQELRRRFRVELRELAFAARLRREPDLRAAVERRTGPPRPEEGLLDGILGFLERREHPVTVDVQLATVTRGQRFEGRVVQGDAGGHRVGTIAVRSCSTHVLPSGAAKSANDW